MPMSRTYDLVVACDCIHYVRHVTGACEALAKTLADATAPSGLAVLCFEPRRFRWVQSEPFVPLLEKHFDVEHVELSALARDAPSETGWGQWLALPEHGWLRRRARAVGSWADIKLVVLTRRAAGVPEVPAMLDPADMQLACDRRQLIARS